MSLFSVGIGSKYDKESLEKIVKAGNNNVTREDLDNGTTIRYMHEVKSIKTDLMPAIKEIANTCQPSLSDSLMKISQYNKRLADVQRQ
jgi:hypothetical protein